MLRHVSKQLPVPQPKYVSSTTELEKLPALELVTVGLYVDDPNQKAVMTAEDAIAHYSNFGSHRYTFAGRADTDEDSY